MAGGCYPLLKKPNCQQRAKYLCSNFCDETETILIKTKWDLKNKWI